MRRRFVEDFEGINPERLSSSLDLSGGFEFGIQGGRKFGEKRAKQKIKKSVWLGGRTGRAEGISKLSLNSKK